jgi:flagellar M-ring protein FliF
MAEQDIIPASPAARLQMGGPMGGVRSFMAQPAVTRSLPIIGLLAALAIAAAAWWTFQTPPQRPLFEGLAENDKAAVASSLQSAGINYKLDGGSGAISVADQDFHKARMLLAGQGLPKAAPSGDALVSAIPMGASRAVEGQTLKAAREADLARTIEAIDAVASARVHLATPEPSLFVRDAAEPAASVMLRLQTGRTLADAQVRAIGDDRVQRLAHRIERARADVAEHDADRCEGQLESRFAGAVRLSRLLLHGRGAVGAAP